MVGQKAHVGAMTLSDHDDATGDRKDLLAHQLGYVGIGTASACRCSMLSGTLCPSVFRTSSKEVTRHKAYGHNVSKKPRA